MLCCYKEKIKLLMVDDVTTGKFHAAFFEEHSMPGDIKSIEETKIVRLKSKMHHTGGSDTIEGSLVHLEELSSKIHLSENNIWKDPIEWDGQLPITWVIPKWF